jgi:hypothetical protein
MHEKLILPEIRLECYEEIEIIAGHRRGWMKTDRWMRKERKPKAILAELT